MTHMRTLLERAWWAVYRATGAYALDRNINERRARQDKELATRLETAGLHAGGASLRELAAWRRAW